MTTNVQKIIYTSMSPPSLPLTIWREKRMSMLDEAREFNDLDFPNKDDPRGGLMGRAPVSGVVGKLRTLGERGSLSNGEWMFNELNCFRSSSETPWADCSEFLSNGKTTVFCLGDVLSSSPERKNPGVLGLKWKKNERFWLQNTLLFYINTLKYI